MRVSTAISSARPPSPVPRITATSGTAAVRARTARSASSIIRPSGRAVAVERPQLGELALEQGAETGDVALELPLHLGGLLTDRLLGGARLVQQPPRLALRLAHDHLRLALGRRARRLAQLLRRDQRLVHGALALAVRPQLLAQRRHPLLQHGPLAQDALQLVGHAHPEVLDAERLVAPQRAPEFLLADVVRRQVERVFAHVALGPNRAVPKRIIVAPSSTAGT